MWDLPSNLYMDFIDHEIGSWAEDDEWVSDELALCFGFEDLVNPKRGFLYFMRRHWFLTDKNGKVCLFRPTPTQWQYLMNCKNENIELKARKLGMSTVIDGKYYWRARRREFQNMFIIAHTNDASSELWRRIQFAHECIVQRRPWLAAPTVRSNRRELMFSDNQSQLRILTAGGKGIGRAADADGLHFSEAAHYDDFEGVLAAAGEARRSGCWVDIETTPNGYDKFRQRYFQAKEPKSRLTPHFYPWWIDNKNSIPHSEVEEYTDEENALILAQNLTPDQIAWRRDKQKELGALFLQEHPEDDETCFITAGYPLFDIHHLKLLLHIVQKEVEEVPQAVYHLSPFSGDDGGRLKVWTAPSEGRTYVIGADIAEGLEGRAYSVAAILDITDPAMEMVAEWRGHINPFEFGKFTLPLLGHWYGRCIVGPERNTHGVATIAGLREAHYPRIYKHRSILKSRSTGTVNARYGWPTQGETKDLMLGTIRKALVRGELIVRSERFIREAMAMKADYRNSAEVQSGEWSDSVIAWSIALMMKRKHMPIIA